jgi:hypothetical protein
MNADTDGGVGFTQKTAAFPVQNGEISDRALKVSCLFSQVFSVIIDVTLLFSCVWEEIGGGGGNGQVESREGRKLRDFKCFWGHESMVRVSAN